MLCPAYSRKEEESHLDFLVEVMQNTILNRLNNENINIALAE
jgi:hypothetical protein